MKGTGIDPNPEKSISGELAKLQDDFLRWLLERGYPDGACELDEIDTMIRNIDRRIRIIEAVLLKIAIQYIGKSKVGKIVSTIDEQYCRRLRKK